ncbi:MAG: F0F1 ATP synthase subunit beta, partial [Anaerolineales bacterium]|nr:F0F1 ATP synthase subunit beta [Anaerolineales bacterium]
MAKATGRIIQIQGGVVDVEFSPGELPDIYEALEIPVDGQEPMVLEVQNHLGDNQVRCVAMDTTDGLQRGLKVYTTGAPIKVPVGDATLGRVFNVLGRPIDAKGAVQADRYYPIH